MATIRTAADRIAATVGAIAKPKQGEYGEYQSVLFEGPGLPGGKVWRAMDPDQAQQFQRGQLVYLVPTTNKRGKPSWDIELLNLDTAAPTAPSQDITAPQGPDPKAIAIYLDQMCDLYAACYRRANRAMDGAPEPAIQAAASSVFIAAQRKFNLA